MASAFALLLISQFSNAAPTLTFNKLSWSFYLKRILFSWWTIFSSDCNLMAKSFTDSRDSSCARNFTKLFVAEVFSHVKYHIVCFFPSSRYLIFSILDINVKRHHSQPYQNQYRNSQWRQSLKYCPVQFLLLPLLKFRTKSQQTVVHKVTERHPRKCRELSVCVSTHTISLQLTVCVCNNRMFHLRPVSLEKKRKWANMQIEC